MHEREKGTASIDVIAAGINAEAARIVSLAEEEARSSQQLAAMSGSVLFSHESEEDQAAKVAGHERQAALRSSMAAEAEKIRDAAAKLQRLVRDARGSRTADAA